MGNWNTNSEDLYNPPSSSILWGKQKRSEKQPKKGGIKEWSGSCTTENHDIRKEIFKN